MFICPQCAEPFEILPEQTAPYVCPACQSRLRPQAKSAWIDVARLTNLAEAGFLSDELNGLDIEARVFQADEFSELGGGRTTAYVIRVPSEAAHEAAARIRGYADDVAADEDAGAAGFRFGGETGPIDPAYWRPVAIVMLAGVASFVLGRQTALPEAQRRPQRDSLAAAVDAIGRPLVTEARPGQPRYRLTHDRSQQVWYIDLDRNGDGAYDVRREFQATGTAW